MTQQATGPAAPLLPLHQQHLTAAPSASVSACEVGSPCSIAPTSPSASRRRPRRSSSVPVKLGAGSSSYHQSARPKKDQQQPQPHAQDLASLHSGSAVAGFVVGTTFEACLVGLVALLHLYHNLPHEDPLLCGAILTLAVVLAWSLLFQVVLFQLDALFPTHKHDPYNNLYGHFNMGLAWGMGLECILLQFIFQRRSTYLSHLLSPISTTVGMTSIIFGLGCVGMTVMRTYYHSSPSCTSTKMITPPSSSSSFSQYSHFHHVGVAGMV
jgi:hypothetical protein